MVVYMLHKLLVVILFLAAQFLIAWYGYFSGKLPVRGSFWGLSYESVFIRSLVTQLEFFWVLVIINLLYSMAFHVGFGSYKNFLVISILYLASGPISALLFNALVAKEKLDVALIIGILLITIGGILVVAHKEILELF